MSQENEKIEKHISNWRVPESIGEQAAWERLMEAKSQHKPVRKIDFRRIGQIAAGLAAAVLLVFVLAESGVLAHREHNQAMASQTVWLPDSSLIQLKAYSAVKYHYQKIGGARLIELRGEARFEVKEGNRFEVEFPGGHLEVLGTEFTVQAYSEESARIDCFSGSVKVKLDKQHFILKGGQAIVFDQTGTGGPFNINPEQKLNLPDNTYYWENRPLREVLTLICQRENYTLEAADQILRKNFTGPLQLDKPEKAIGILARAMNFDYQLNNNKLQIVEKD